MRCLSASAAPVPPPLPPMSAWPQRSLPLPCLQPLQSQPLTPRPLPARPPRIAGAPRQPQPHGHAPALRLTAGELQAGSALPARHPLVPQAGGCCADPTLLTPASAVPQPRGLVHRPSAASCRMPLPQPAPATARPARPPSHTPCPAAVQRLRQPGAQTRRRCSPRPGKQWRQSSHLLLQRRGPVQRAAVERPRAAPRQPRSADGPAGLFLLQGCYTPPSRPMPAAATLLIAGPRQGVTAAPAARAGWRPPPALRLPPSRPCRRGLRRMRAPAVLHQGKGPAP